ncbi:MerR family transcriptional regulator [Palleronia aestuarii]|uniref:MerR family transcriptional regulator n=1 Tax=Palleronia aestuarii TaxID=568105 RepID=A0A2W7N6A6_9RHOB|nr:MerR family DNA-binding transcriptional regulator [Palleronia aestuarii]PZX15243.1 MerR family transcriptional regulator [Palleronia aestuarii]
MTEARVSFKDMCARFDVTPRTLRYYEYIELIAPEREGRARFYGPREIARLTLILRGRRWGFSLEEIRQWLEIYDQRGTVAQLRETLTMADRQIEHLRSEVRQTERAIAELQEMRDGVAKHLEEHGDGAD